MLAHQADMWWQGGFNNLRCWLCCMRNRLRTCTTFNSSKLGLLVASCVWCGCLRCGMLLSRGYGHLLHLKGQALMDELRRQGGLDEEELVMLQYMLCDYRERVSSEAL
mgnify:FL=1